MALNPEIVQLVTQIQLFAVSQAITEKRAFQIAMVRICKQWAVGQTVPQGELQTVGEALAKLSDRLAGLQAVSTGAVATVAASHQTEVDVIVNGATVPE